MGQIWNGQNGRKYEKSKYFWQTKILMILSTHPEDNIGIKILKSIVTKHSLFCFVLRNWGLFKLRSTQMHYQNRLIKQEQVDRISKVFLFGF